MNLFGSWATSPIILMEIKVMNEMYLDILRIVEEVTGVSATEMLTSNCEEHVDARHILVYTLSCRGYSDTKISQLTKLTRPCVCMIRNSFKYRQKRYFVNLNYQIVYSRVFGDKESVKKL